MFNLQFETSNAAFQELSSSSEVYRILLAIANKVKQGDREGIVSDLNGNKVGSWKLDNKGGSNV